MADMNKAYDEGFTSYKPATIYDPRSNKYRGKERKAFANGWAQAMWNWLQQPKPHTIVKGDPINKTFGLE